MSADRAAVTLQLTPQGHLHLIETDEAPPIDAKLAARLTRAFEGASGEGLLDLGPTEVGTALPAVISYWRDFAARYVTAVCATPALQGRPQSAVVPPPDAAALQAIVNAAPPMDGIEYLTPQVAER